MEKSFRRGEEEAKLRLRYLKRKTILKIFQAQEGQMVMLNAANEMAGRQVYR